MDERMREVAQAGDVDDLYALIQENPFVLANIDAVPFIDTPLHMAASEGHIDFVMEMMNLKPSYARKLNPIGFTPKHLALLNHRTLIVSELLKIDKDLVRVKGRGGLTPMHLAVEDGKLDFVAKFLEACPECITDVTIQGQTAIQIAARNNNFDILELLVCWFGKTTHKDSVMWKEQVLNMKDREGNTVLHIAASNNHLQMVKLLLKSNICKNEINLNGRSALDMLQGQVNNSETADTLRRAGCVEGARIPAPRTLAESLRSKTPWLETFRRTMARQNNKISSDMRNAMLVVAVLILTASYQASLSPPGGVWQGNIDSSGSSTTDKGKINFGGGSFIDPSSSSSSTTNKGNIDFSNTTTLSSLSPFTNSSDKLGLKNKNPSTGVRNREPFTDSPNKFGFNNRKPSREIHSSKVGVKNKKPFPKIHSSKVGVNNEKPFTDSSSDKVGVSVMSTLGFAYFYSINAATFLTTTCLVFFLLPDETINLLAIPVLLFILCYLLSMIYLAPFSFCILISPFASASSPILVATVIFFIVCAPKFLDLYLRSRRSLL
ncbi:hypothetical protein SLA2020_178220 [Shorea laevis]